MAKHTGFYTWRLCNRCGKVVSSNWKNQHLRTDCNHGGHTLEELGIICSFCDGWVPAKWGGAVFGTSGLACAHHVSELRDAVPIFSDDQRFG